MSERRRMADGTDIEWARHPVTGKGASWNPVLARKLDTGRVGYHCEHVSPGCEHCYAEAFNLRGLPARGTTLEFKPGHRKDVEIFLDAKQMRLPLQWREPRGIFVCSMSDLFGDFVTDEQIDQVFAVMALAPQHIYFVLTKRAQRMRRYFSGIDNGNGEWIDGAENRDALIEGSAQKLYEQLHPGEDSSMWLAVHAPLPNVWLGVSVEDQRRADERIPDLLATPAAKRFISAEPLLEGLDLREYLDGREIHGMVGQTIGFIPPLDWVIAGFESGTQSPPCPGAPDIARSLRDQCARFDVPYFFKQFGSWAFAPDGYDFNTAMAWARNERHSLSHRSSDWGGMGGNPTRYEHFSDGRTAFYTTKAKAGRLLDGVEHNAMPEIGR
jgi:protein gp37